MKIALHKICKRDVVWRLLSRLSFKSSYWSTSWIICGTGKL